MEAKRKEENWSVALFFGLVKLGLTAYFMYHFIGWLTL